MTTTILEELKLPEDRRAALSRESLRTGKPASQLIREWVLEKSERLLRSSGSGSDSCLNFTNPRCRGSAAKQTTKQTTEEHG